MRSSARAEIRHLPGLFESYRWSGPFGAVQEERRADKREYAGHDQCKPRCPLAGYIRKLGSQHEEGHSQTGNNSRNRIKVRPQTASTAGPIRMMRRSKKEKQQQEDTRLCNSFWQCEAGRSDDHVG